MEAKDGCTGAFRSTRPLIWSGNAPSSESASFRRLEGIVHFDAFGVTPYSLAHGNVANRIQRLSRKPRPVIARGDDDFWAH